MMIGDNKEMIVLLRKKRSKWYTVACFGRMRHYRKDGSCKHTDEVLARVKPEARNRVKVDPFGGARKEQTK